MRPRNVLAWGVASTSMLLALAGAVFNLLAGDEGLPAWTGLVAVAAVAAPAVVGIVIAHRRPSNAIAWVLLADALLLSLMAFAQPYGRYTLLAEPGGLPGGELAALWDSAAWPSFYAGIAAIGFVFPDGRLLPGRRWRVLAAVAIASLVAILTAQIFGTQPLNAPFEDVDRPLPSLPDAVTGSLMGLATLGLLAGLVAAAVAVRSRYKRAVGQERLQLRWLALAAALIPSTLVIAGVDALIFSEIGVLTILWIAATEIAIPAAVGVAVMRYRLYEIDRIVNRTLVYATLTVLLAATYALVTLAAAVALGDGSTWATALATLAVAAAFRPLRARVQVAVDRRFNRPRYEGLRTVDRFLSDLRAGRAAPERAGVVLAEALEDPTAELRYWLTESSAYANERGQEVTDDGTDSRARTPVTRGDVPLGVLLHDPRLLDKRDLLDSVVTAAGLAIEIARLRVEVNRHLAAVEASRARIVQAGYEERKRLERDLHDGAQQRLVSIGLALRHAQHELPEGEGAIARQLDDAVAEVAQAIEDLRALARGFRPSGLDAGLEAALRELARRSPMAVDVLVDAPPLDRDVETVAYYVAAEALTNAAKHASARHVEVRAVREPGQLVLTVTDDGVGGAKPHVGSGLTGLADRLDAQGGRLVVTSAAGGGTTVTAALPCA